MPRISALRTYQPRHTAHVPNYQLDSLFNDDELTLKLMIAKYRIL